MIKIDYLYHNKQEKCLRNCFLLLILERKPIQTEKPQLICITKKFQMSLLWNQKAEQKF